MYTHIIPCPVCHKSLYLVQQSEYTNKPIDIICSHCQTRYRVSSAIDRSLQSSCPQVEERLRKNPFVTAKINYQLQAIDQNCNLIEHNFAVKNNKHNFIVEPKDRLLLVYLLACKNEPQLISIVNQETNQNIQIINSNRDFKNIAVKTGLTTLIIAFILYLSSYIYSFIDLKIIFELTLLSGLSSAFYWWQKNKNEYKEKNLQTLARLSFEQTILEKIYVLDGRIEQLKQDLTIEELLIERFASLKAKMSRTDAGLYRDRIDTISRGIQALEQKLQLNQNLLAGYTQLTQIWEIEYETSQLAEQLPGVDNVEQKVAQRLAELQSLEQQKEELSLMIQPAKLLVG